MAAAALLAGFALLAGGGAAQAKDKVVVTMSGQGFLFLPPMVAAELGYFAEEGIEAELLPVSGGSKALAAVAAGDAQVYVGAPSTAFRAREKGQDSQVIGAVMTQYAIDVIVSRKWAEKTGVTEASPYGKKLAALRGMKIGITAPGSGTDQLVRFLAKAEGIDADRDMTIVTVGLSDSAIAALSQDRIDAFTMSQPAGQTAASKFGAVMLFNMSQGEVKALDGFLYIAAIVKQSWAEKNADLAVRFLRGMQRGLEAIHDPARTSKARDLVWAKYQKSSPKADYDALWSGMAGAFPASIALDRGQMERVAGFLAEFEKTPVEAKTIDAAWTNAYAEKALKGIAP